MSGAAGSGRIASRPAGTAALYALAAAIVAVPLLWDRARLVDAGDEYGFAVPWALLGLLIPAAAMVLRLRPSRRTTTRWRWPVAASVIGGPRAPRVLFRRAPIALRAAALGLCVVALARPQGTRERFGTVTEGIDIVLVLDMSGSMNEQDMFPNRFEVEKDVVRSFIRRRPNDRIGVVVFGSEAYPLSPITSDHATLDRMLADLELGHMPETMQNTAIGDGLAGAVARLLDSDAASKVVVLLTDGMDNESDIDPRDAAAEAARKGVRVYTILLGVQGEVVPPVGVDARGNPIFLGAARRFPVDPALLQDIARTTGGAYHEAAQRKDLEGAFHRILDDLRKTERRDAVVLANERFEFFLFLAAAVLCLEFMARHLWLREFA